MGEFEAILRDTSYLTTVCQNEDKLNGAHGPAMRKIPHDILSSTIMKVITMTHGAATKI